MTGVMADVIWVDENDMVLGRVSREKAHAEALLHRISVTYLVNDKGEILVNERAKDGHLDHSSAGHVDIGETYEDAARRELREELGINMPNLREIGTAQSRDIGTSFDGTSFNSCHIFKVFQTVWNDEVRPNPEEVRSVFWSELPPLIADMDNNPKKYTNGFKESMKVFLSRKLIDEGFPHVYEWHDESGTEYPKHAHKGAVSMYILKGSLTFWFGDEEKEVRSGDRFDVPVGKEHLATGGPEGCDFLVGEMIKGDS